MNAKNPVLDRRSRSHAVLAAALCLALSGCGLLGHLLTSLDQYRPRVSVKDVSLAGVSWDAVDVDFILQIDNPNPIEVTFDSFRYALELDGQPFLKGDQNTGVPFKAYGTSEARLPLKLAWAQVFTAIPAVKKKSKVPFKLSGDLGFQTPLGHVDVPWSKIGSVPKLEPPEVVPAGLRLMNVNLLAGRLQLAVDLDVSNPDGNGAIELSGFSFELALDGQRSASGVVAKLADVPQGQTKRIPLVVNVEVAQVGLVLFKRVSAHGDVQLSLKATAQVKTPFGTFPLTVQRTVGKHVD